jgi:hypothetical protein
MDLDLDRLGSRSYADLGHNGGLGSRVNEGLNIMPINPAQKIICNTHTLKNYIFLSEFRVWQNETDLTKSGTQVTIQSILNLKKFDTRKIHSGHNTVQKISGEISWDSFKV